MTRKTVGKSAALPDPEAASETNSGAKGPHLTNETVKGAPRRLTAQLLDKLCADFQVHGADAIRSCREEQPQGYLRLIAGLLAKDIDLNDNWLKDLADADIDILIEHYRACVAQSEDAEGVGQGKAPATY
jgi:hypothetical protein